MFVNGSLKNASIESLSGFPITFIFVGRVFYHNVYNSVYICTSITPTTWLQLENHLQSNFTGLTPFVSPYIVSSYNITKYLTAKWNIRVTSTVALYSSEIKATFFIGTASYEESNIITNGIFSGSGISLDVVYDGISTVNLLLSNNSLDPVDVFVIPTFL